MKSIICQTPGDIRLIETIAPDLTAGNTLLKVKRIGICGTDLHAYKGNQAFFTYPRILGHELAAEVEHTDPLGSDLRKGDKVVILPYINCQKCEACLAGKTNCCEKLSVFGVHEDGGMQEFISLPTRLLIPANDLSYEQIAIVEPLSIGAHALRRARTKSGETIVVMGCGPIGIGIIQLAKYLGATVIAVDINEYRLEKVKSEFGADYIVNAKDDPIEKVRELTDGSFAHTVFDATGSKMAIEGGINFMRHGGSFVLVGLFKEELSFVHPKIHAKESSILCSRNASMEDFEFVMKVLREGKFNSQGYITNNVSFDQLLTGFEDWTSPDSKEIKVMASL